ncbi:NUDIX domain-containing protein [Streptomyces sp. SGAir0957]
MAKPPTRSIPSSVKAVVLHDSHVLLLQTSFKGEDCYVLPGGAQRHGEDTSRALSRHVYFQTGLGIFARRFLWLREYIGPEEAGPVIESGTHSIEMIFRCSVDAPPVGLLDDPIDYAAGIPEWVELQRVPEINLLPRSLRNPIATLASAEPATGYLGDVVR